jgi:hypothetical protein
VFEVMFGWSSRIFWLERQLLGAPLLRASSEKWLVRLGSRHLYDVSTFDHQKALQFKDIPVLDVRHVNILDRKEPAFQVREIFLRNQRAVQVLTGESP